MALYYPILLAFAVTALAFVVVALRLVLRVARGKWAAAAVVLGALAYLASLPTFCWYGAGKVWLIEHLYDGEHDVVEWVERLRPGTLTAKSTDGSTLLDTAIEDGRLDVVDYLISRGLRFDPGAVSHRWSSSRVDEGEVCRPGPVAARSHLQRAAADGNLPLARKLLELGADARFADADGHTALHAAVAGAHPALAELLIDRGADPSARTHGPALCRRTGSRRDDYHLAPLVVTPAHLAVTADCHDEQPAPACRVRLLRLLAARGADLEVPGTEGETPLARAVERIDSAVVGALLAVGVDGAALDPAVVDQLAEHVRRGVVPPPPIYVASGTVRRRGHVLDDGERAAGREILRLLAAAGHARAAELLPTIAEPAPTAPDQTE